MPPKKKSNEVKIKIKLFKAPREKISKLEFSWKIVNPALLKDDIEWKIESHKLSFRLVSKFKLKSMKKIVKSANKGVTYDMLIAEGNDKGNKLIQNAVDSLIKQSKNIELAAAALNINDLQIEGSDSLDNPDAVFN